MWLHEALRLLVSLDTDTRLGKLVQRYISLPLWNVECEACWWLRGVAFHAGIAFVVGVGIGATFL